MALPFVEPQLTRGVSPIGVISEVSSPWFDVGPASKIRTSSPCDVQVSNKHNIVGASVSELLDLQCSVTCNVIFHKLLTICLTFKPIYIKFWRHKGWDFYLPKTWRDEILGGLATEMSQNIVYKFYLWCHPRGHKVTNLSEVWLSVRGATYEYLAQMSLSQPQVTIHPQQATQSLTYTIKTYTTCMSTTFQFIVLL